MNYRVINGKHIVAGISGGVRCDPSSLVAKDKLKTDTYGTVVAERGNSAPKQVAPRGWWWD